MAAPRSMLSGVLNPLKGWPDTATLDVSAEFSTAAKAALDPIPAGRCVHLNSSGKFDLGCQNEVGKIHMPIFTFHWSDHPDVSNEGGITGSADDDPDGWIGVKRNKMMGIVATAGVELQTDQYDGAGTYTPGVPLQASTANKGLISPGTLGTHMIIGTCSKVEGNISQLATSRAVITFWPLCLPVQP